MHIYPTNNKLILEKSRGGGRSDSHPSIHFFHPSITLPYCKSSCSASSDDGRESYTLAQAAQGSIGSSSTRSVAVIFCNHNARRRALNDGNLSDAHHFDFRPSSMLPSSIHHHSKHRAPPYHHHLNNFKALLKRKA